MKALVTGVAGFIGSHVAEKLVEMGVAVVGIDDLSAGYESNIPKGVEFYQRDVCNVIYYGGMLDGVDVVFHQAASKKNICLKNPARDMEVNGIGTLKLLQQCIEHKVKKFVHASTGSVYGEVKGVINENIARNPQSFYGVSKTAGETYVTLFNKQSGLDTTILRYFHVYGDRQESKQETGGVVAIFTDKIIKGEPIYIHGDGTQKRVFTYVKDIVEANIMSWQNPISNGKVYNCASFYQMSVIDLAQALMEKYNKKVSIIYTAPLVGDIYNFKVDSYKIQSELGVTFRPITHIL
jgi:nucleoside-diphosphate-sugar epimerase